jgi:hypothetical protein
VVKILVPLRAIRGNFLGYGAGEFSWDQTIAQFRGSSVVASEVLKEALDNS